MSREIHKIASLRRDSWRSSDDVFSRSSSRFQDEEDDEEALRWAALERLPTRDRARTAVLDHFPGRGDGPRAVDVGRLGAGERAALLRRVASVADDHGRFLARFKERVDRVGIELPTIEVRYENLSVEAEAYVGSRGLPTILHTYANVLEVYILKILYGFFSISS